jgi:predicted transcriptional regulator YdeE
MAFEITIKEFPARHLVGMVVRTNMLLNASTDCPAVWQAFGPRIVSFPNSANITEAYGVSVMIGNDGTFDYWAAVEMPVGTELPEGMATFDLPAGLYACTFSPNLEQMEATYHEIYLRWPQQQSDYAVIMQAPCVEVYRNGWQPADPLELWVPVVKKR